MSFHASVLRLTFWSTSLALALGCSSGSSDDGDGGVAGKAGNVGGSGGSGGPGGAAGSGVTAGSGTTAGTGTQAGSGGSAGAPSFGGQSGAAGSAGANTGGASAGAAGAVGGGGSSGAGVAGGPSGGSGGAAGASGGTGGGGGTAGKASGGAGGGGSDTTGRSAGCGKAPGISSDQYNNGKPISIMAGNMQRRYVLAVPNNYDNTRAYRLIISYHQRDGNDIQNYNWQFYGLRPLSNDTTIFVAPNGQLNGQPCTGMGDGQSNCGWPNPNNSDLALADAVVAQIKENFCVDTNRIFATGWSFGGAMSYQTACARPLGNDNGYIRGVAVYSGSAQITQGPCPPMKQVAYFGAHGTNDNVLQYSGGVSMAQNFAKANGCTWSTPQQASGQHVCTNISGCMTGYPVEFCSFVGGHTPFPDNGQAQGSWGPGEAWKFLSQF